MMSLPPKANLDHLRKQAKALLRDYRRGDAAATARFAGHLPAAARGLPAGLRLHDAQSCIAREYGFASWAALSLQVQASAFARGDRASAIRRWLHLAYGGDVTGSYDAARPLLAAKLWPTLAAGDRHVACAVGDLAGIAQAIAAGVDTPSGPLNLPPLVAVTHSQLGQVAEFRPRLHAAARALLQAGADPNQGIAIRFPPDAAGRLSALYGAAGVNRDPVLTVMLLDAGADPNDGESLYHSLENPDCTRILLRHGARVAGTNALRRALDMAEPEALELLLAHGGDPNEPAGGGPTQVWGAPLLRAIALRRSARHIAALLDAGADPRAQTPLGIGAYSLAMQLGLAEVAALLDAAGAAAPLTPAEAFVAACARADAEAARAIQADHPELPAALPADRLRLMPDTAAWGARAAVECMVACGWPIDARGGDWDATALNHAVFRGDAALTGFLLAHGARWQERHGYGGDVLGTLSWASRNDPADVAAANWAGCARALVAHGLPAAVADPSDPERLRIGDQTMVFSAEVAEIITGAAR